MDPFNVNQIMKKITLAGVLVVAFSTGLAQAKNVEHGLINFRATFSSGQEVGPINPKTPVNAAALGTFTYNKHSHELTFNIQYNHLSGVPTMAHFHHGAFGKGGPIVQWICGSQPSLLGKCPASSAGTLKGTWHVPNEDVQLLLTDQIFVNIHTKLNPEGEIRAQLNP